MEKEAFNLLFNRKLTNDERVLVLEGIEFVRKAVQDGDVPEATKVLDTAVAKMNIYKFKKKYGIPEDSIIIVPLNKKV